MDKKNIHDYFIGKIDSDVKYEGKTTQIVKWNTEL